jgi:PGF-CTERM protein
MPMNAIRSATLLGVLGLFVLVASGGAAAADVTLTVGVETEAGDPVDGATLTATWSNGSTTATTASNGKAFIDVPEGESVEITVDHDEYMRNSPLVVEDASARDVTMTVHSTSEATVRVVDQEGSIDDALVELSQDEETVVAERTTDGSIETGAIEAGTYDLRVAKAGYYTVTDAIEVPADEAAEREVELERGSVTLQANVTDPYFDPPRPLSDISVTVDGQGTVNTQSDGRQQLSVPVNTDLTVRFTHPEYETVTRSIEAGESALTVSASLHRADLVNVTPQTTEVVVGQPAFITATDEYGDPVTNVTVRVDGEAVTETDGDGWARIPIEEAGVHEITVEDSEATSNVTEILGVEEGSAETSVIETPTTSGTETPTGTTDTSLPGFGPIAALLGIALAIGLAGRRR